ncbi:Predicted arabinose efflux permease, MFS family [Tessaracoccus bendigoensis DSM 12906]|uniref:Predicted arabinose efflux permease, MFS family n=1 Tax=Tessaracoccus bendigoensis DSM 12906 TaxID=1123357 RepID=A0A1M6N6N5_9ACTN|nr:MFS transporter [Tessaracoccus bendigoensis]SHJ91283.1 Predicted arabinose efflux permease, MFS family [Tessaracoccus bendigoensis DSM 12906]
MHQGSKTRLWGGGYPLWLASDTAFELASALAGFAVPLLALMITDEPVLAGIIGATGLVMRMVSSLVGGVLADRHSRVALMLVGALVGIVLAVVFTALTFLDLLGYVALLLLNLGFAFRNGLFGTANQSALKDVVAPDAFGRAQASNQGRDAVMSLAGSPLGGVLLGLGAPILGGVMAISQLVAAVSAAALRRRTPAVPVGHGGSERRRFGAELAEGFRWVFSRPDLRGTLLVTTLINLGFNAAISTVVYSLQQAGSSPTAIGLVTGGLGVGMLLGAALAPVLVPRVPTGWLGIGGVLLVAVAMAVMPLVTHPLAVAVVLAVAVLGAPALNAALLGYFMVATPREVIGRATSALSVFAMGAMPLAPLVAGFGLTWVGRSGTLLATAAICLAAAALAALTSSLRRLPVEADWGRHAEAQSRELVEPRVG